MSRSTKKIDALAELLEKSGGDALRLDVVRRTQKFKRSWIDLAEVLVQVRRTRAHERWGFTDFFAYCNEELLIKRATAEKLVLSFSTIQDHAPEVLKWDGVAQTIPSYEAVDYYARAVVPVEAEEPRARGKLAPVPPTDELRAEMKQAVFDEGTPVGELRRRFDPVLYPKPKAAHELETIQRASAAARRLAELLPDIQGLSAGRVKKLEEQLGGLRDELDALAEPLKEKVARAQKRTRAKAPRLRALPTS
ncbi:MAG: hypothetical protein R3A51_17025 [Nannocystaceae bacterium]|nr:hypothetical protein [Myxococcales bacterium]